MKAFNLIFFCLLSTLFILGCTNKELEPRYINVNTEPNIYGEIYSKNNIIPTNITGVDTYENVSEGVIPGLLKGMINRSGQLLVIEESGVYSAVSSYSAIGGNNKVFHLAIGVNGLDSNKCHIPRKISANDQGGWSISCLLNLSVGDTVGVMVENVNDDSNILITDMNLFLEKID